MFPHGSICHNVLTILGCVLSSNPRLCLDPELSIAAGMSHAPRAGFAVRGEMGAKDGVVKAVIFEGEDELDAPHTMGAAEAARDTIAWWDSHTGSA